MDELQRLQPPADLKIVSIMAALVKRRDEFVIKLCNFASVSLNGSESKKKKTVHYLVLTTKFICSIN